MGPTAGTSANEPWVLIVEDDQESATVLGEALAGVGLKVVYAHAVPEAMAKLRMQRFAAVLLDLQLTQSSGELLIPFMKTQRGMNDHTPIVIISAFVDVELVRRIRSDVDDVLVKPFDLRTLISRVTALLGWSPAEPSPVPAIPWSETA